ncbi:MAG: DUF4920 domain-containing protein [Gemmatimonadaceae bacterium]|nr:DUF4920 domain-containing protein [Gemmatimonadaceae bacterium]
MKTPRVSTLARALAVVLALSVSTAATATAQSKDYGKALTLKEATPISSILQDPKAWDGKRVLVEGLIIEVCEERGCWIRIASDKAFESLRFKVDDGVMTFPQDARGRTVRAEGIVKVRTLSRDQAIAQAREVAKERGTLASFDSSKVKGPVTDVQLSGEGARVR